MGETKFCHKMTSARIRFLESKSLRFALVGGLNRFELGKGGGGWQANQRELLLAPTKLLFTPTKTL